MYTQCDCGRRIRVYKTGRINHQRCSWCRRKELTGPKCGCGKLLRLPLRKNHKYGNMCCYCAKKAGVFKQTKTKHQHRREGLKSKYGISYEQYLSRWALQHGRCAICKKHSMNLKRALAVDHCHQTRKLRGLLCGSCNRGIGLLGDSVERMEAALSYLKKAA